MEAFCDEHLDLRITLNDPRASFTTQCFEQGLTAAQESRIVGHSPAVAEKHYSDYEAQEARDKLPPDPLQEAGVTGEPGGVRVQLKVAK